MIKPGKKNKELCAHCGEPCPEAQPGTELNFCCNGCATVYEILNTHDFQKYYCLNEKPGITVKPVAKSKFAYLDQPENKAEITRFKNATQTVAVFYLPQIHCSSCLWLLEHLSRFNANILGSQVNFITKKITVTFLHNNLSLREVAELLSMLGYTPHTETDTADAKATKNIKPVIKLGVAFFCFANIMMFSFPEYVGLNHDNNPQFLNFFRTANLILSLPVLLYCAREIFENAWKGLINRHINIDTPIALAILVCFLRSVGEILNHTGPGYLDSMSGIVLLMLAGRFLQNKVFNSLQFDRTSRSFFPIGVTTIKDGIPKYSSAENIVPGDILVLHQEEIVPVECILSTGNIKLDNSFITGEPMLVSAKAGDSLFAGAKIAEGSAEVIVTKSFAQNNFLQLWEETQKKDHQQQGTYIDKLSRWFSAAIILLATGGFIYWQINDPALSWKVVTSVLIIACPCTLLLASTFLNSFLLSRFGSKGFYLKNYQVLEKICNANKIVFDKTGTLTKAQYENVRYEGMDLTAEEKNLFLNLLSLSRHPLCQAVVANEKFATKLVENYKEVHGKGMEAWVEDKHYKAGNKVFANAQNSEEEKGSAIYLSIDNAPKGKFIIENHLRPGIPEMIIGLQEYKPTLLSGDNKYNYKNFTTIFPTGAQLLFEQTPQEKFNYVKGLGENGKQVIMVGDGLNDAGALSAASVGIAVADQSFSFTPACDAIISAGAVSSLHQFIQASLQAKKLVRTMLLFSLLYNFAGLSFALSGQLQPLVAAVLMPASSLSVILFAWLGAKRINKRIPEFSNSKI